MIELLPRRGKKCKVFCDVTLIRNDSVFIWTSSAHAWEKHMPATLE